MNRFTSLLLALFLLGSRLHAQTSGGPGPRIAEAAQAQIGVTTDYDPAYVSLAYPGGDVSLAYPGGDVPLRTGVCSDVVVRALRTVNIDLQKEVHEDMRKNFSVYPKNWGLRKPDKNIDHRRVPNLMRYFERHHIALAENGARPKPICRETSWPGVSTAACFMSESYPAKDRERLPGSFITSAVARGRRMCSSHIR